MRRTAVSIAELETDADLGTVIGPERNGTLMTAEEFDAAEEWDEDYAYELIRGVLIVSPAALPAERGPNAILVQLLLNYREQHPEGAALDATLDEHTIKTPTGRRRADRVIWTGLGRTPDWRADVPSIVVEFVSSGKRNRRRDYVEKRDEYAAIGVREYWVIDRFRATLTCFHGGEAEVIVPRDGIHRTPLLPGFELPLVRLLDEADRWK